MEKKKFLNEEDYQRNKKKITKIAIIILIVGILIGGSLIVTGLIKQNETNSQYSEDSKADLQKQIDDERQNLLTKKEELEQVIQESVNDIQTQIDNLETELATLKAEQSNEFRANGFSEKYYTLENNIDKVNSEIDELETKITEEKNKTNVIDNVLSDTFNYCSFSEAQNNEYTSKYCSLKDQLNNLNDFNKSFTSSKYIPFYIFGAFIIIASAMIAGSIYMFAKRREIFAFTTQQVMPVAKEGIEEMAPTITKVAKKGIEEMAPAIGNVAKEISKGIKEGTKDDKK